MSRLGPAGSGAQAGWTPREWDSSFFGVSIAQLTTETRAVGELAETVRQADRASIDCLYYLVDAGDLTGIRAAEANGFSLVDIRLTLDCRVERSSRGLKPPRYEADASQRRTPRYETDSRDDTDVPQAVTSQRHEVRAARPDDVPRLKELARVSHDNTRFYVDSHFDRHRCGEMYALWIERSVAGELADAVWVVDVNGVPCGYLTAKTDRDVGTIGLVAVDVACRGRGYGDALLEAALTCAAEGGLSSLSVVTQGRSAAAVRFYQRAGFLTRAVELWYHRWRHADADDR